MNQLDFNLIPFDNKADYPLQITGNISLRNCQLTIDYQLKGDLSELIIPSFQTTPIRQKNLWEHTCFEFFLNPKNTTQYWEFNLSPGKHWNVFRFDDYRQNMIEDITFRNLPFEVKLSNKALTINVNINLVKILSIPSSLDIAIAAVIETKNRPLSYWSLIHPASEADFHHPDSFIINIST